MEKPGPEAEVKNRGREIGGGRVWDGLCGGGRSTCLPVPGAGGCHLVGELRLRLLGAVRPLRFRASSSPSGRPPVMLQRLSKAKRRLMSSSRQALSRVPSRLLSLPAAQRSLVLPLLLWVVVAISPDADRATPHSHFGPLLGAPPASPASCPPAGRQSQAKHCNPAPLVAVSVAAQALVSACRHFLWLLSGQPPRTLPEIAPKNGSPPFGFFLYLCSGRLPDRVTITATKPASFSNTSLQIPLLQKLIIAARL